MTKIISRVKNPLDQEVPQELIDWLRDLVAKHAAEVENLENTLETVQAEYTRLQDYNEELISMNEAAMQEKETLAEVLEDERLKQVSELQQMNKALIAANASQGEKLDRQQRMLERATIAMDHQLA